MKKVRGLVITAALGVWTLALSRCQSSSPEAETQGRSPWWNHGDSVHYVGIETCKTCHFEIYATYVETGMGRSFGAAHPERSALGSHPPGISDSALDLSYRPIWQKDQLFLLEYRLDASGDTLHRWRQPLDWIIGSGHHTNSHLWQANGYVHQAPYTYYTQQTRADLPPGFERGQNSRFSRPIGLECMSCHNAMPLGFDLLSLNRFEELPQGIDCERCHGPGSAHVRKIQSGKVTDTAQGPDFSIVNPGRLSIERRFDICQRCHLQGNAVLKPGSDWMDFRPGMRLYDHIEVYSPVSGKAQQGGLIMAGHAERLRESACFQSSKTLDCTTCHNPHHSVRNRTSEVFNQTCAGCHATGRQGSGPGGCSLAADQQRIEKQGCVGCHMPASGSEDIPHVRVHDHKIGVHRPTDPASGLPDRLGCINCDTADRLSRMTAYLQQYEQFESRDLWLDSAAVVLAQLDPGADALESGLRLDFLRKDYAGVLRRWDAAPTGTRDALFSKDRTRSQRAWTAYRLAEALSESGRAVEADQAYRAALEALPAHPPFRVQYAHHLLENGQTSEALEAYREAIRQFPMDADAHNGLGFGLLQKGEWDLARASLERALDLDPDHLLAGVNLCVLDLTLGRWAAAEQRSTQLVARHGNHPKLQRLIREIQLRNPPQ
ncbi:tetratricopeptide repeat protein [bacterium]|nr:tetratricopeptide repeat protein [bacterium]